jgi:hypothetical protein
LTNARLTSGFWVAAKLRQIQNTGGYASILVKGNEEAGAITLVLRARDGTLRLAVMAMSSLETEGERNFEWHDQTINDQELSELIRRELRFDRDQWFVECECSNEIFEETFGIAKS